MELTKYAEHFVFAATIMAGIITTTFLSLITAYFQWKAKKDISQVNDAVNHRHEKGHGALKLYDLVWENHIRSNELIEWKRSYDKGPLDDGTKVTTFVEEIESFRREADDHFNILDKKIDNLEQKPPCAIHDEQLIILRKMQDRHTERLDDLEKDSNERFS
jgi:hypothetical protein